jgi:hypothetical protein
VAVDVTDLVRQWVSGSPIRGVMLDPTSSNGVKLRSTEFADSTLRPHFVVEVIQ